jgi:hypothetical protein
VTGNVTGGNIISVGAVSAGAAGISTTGNVTGGNVLSNGLISATGNITGANVVGTLGVFSGNLSATANTVTSNLQVTGNSSGTGIGVENIVWQPTTVAFDSVSQANVGVLGFLVLGGYSYKYEAYLPILPDGSTTTGFSTRILMQVPVTTPWKHNLHRPLRLVHQHPMCQAPQRPLSQ